MLYRIGRNNVEKLIEDVDEAQKYLEHEPVTTIEFVEYLEYIDASQAKADAMEAELDYCKELYDIMEEFHIPVSYDDMSNYLGLSVTMSSLRNMVDRKIEDYPKFVKKLVDKMNKDISDLICEVGVIKDECLVRFTKDHNVQIIAVSFLTSWYRLALINQFVFLYFLKDCRTVEFNLRIENTNVKCKTEYRVLFF